MSEKSTTYMHITYTNNSTPPAPPSPTPDPDKPGYASSLVYSAVAGAAVALLASSFIRPIARVAGNGLRSVTIAASASAAAKEASDAMGCAAGLAGRSGFGAVSIIAPVEASAAVWTVGESVGAYAQTRRKRVAATAVSSSSWRAFCDSSASIVARSVLISSAR